MDEEAEAQEKRLRILKDELSEEEQLLQQSMENSMRNLFMQEKDMAEECVRLEKNHQVHMDLEMHARMLEHQMESKFQQLEDIMAATVARRRELAARHTCEELNQITSRLENATRARKELAEEMLQFKQQLAT